MGCSVDWAGFLVAMVVVELTPGPNMGWLTALSAQHGRRVGLMAVAGVTLGLTAQLLLAVTGVTALLSQSPLLYHSLRWAGVAFMLYLAWEAWAETGETSPGTADGLAGFRRGFVANLLNPKALVFYVAIVGQFALCREGGQTLLFLRLGAIHIAISVAVHCGLVMLGSALGNSVATWRQSVPLRLGFAFALAAIAVWIAFSTG